MSFTDEFLLFSLWQSDSEVHIHWKGAAELVLASCSGYLDSNGCKQPINEDKVWDYVYSHTQMHARKLLKDCLGKKIVRGTSFSFVTHLNTDTLGLQN